MQLATLVEGPLRCCVGAEYNIKIKIHSYIHKSISVRENVGRSIIVWLATKS